MDRPHLWLLTGLTDGVVRMWSLDYVQELKDETPPTTQPAVKQQVVAAEESEEESPDDEVAPPAPLQRQGSICRLPNSCGSENEPGPDSTSSSVSPSAETNDNLLETEQPVLRSSRSESERDVRVRSKGERHPSDTRASAPYCSNYYLRRHHKIHLQVRNSMQSHFCSAPSFILIDDNIE